MSRLLYPLLVLLFMACGKTSPNPTGKREASITPRPNIVLIFVDDMGYGDLGCYGSNRIATPHLDHMASEGMKLTDFYAFPSCSPSRAALMTGCYPPRVGIPEVVGPPGPDWTKNRQYGLHPDETTLAEVLQKAGYATGMIGKWHLGHFAETMPTRQGFDYFFGLPYSNDMLPENGYPDLPLYENEQITETNPDQRQLTKRYTERAVDYLEQHRDSSFFLYLAHAMPHVPLYASADFADRHPKDPYANVIEEIDWSVGEIMSALEEEGLKENTLVIFTSDNGPWLSYGDHAGSAGPFREGKGTTFEGGMRVPALLQWPAGLPAGVNSQEVMALIDVLPTLAAVAGAEAHLPNQKLDGRVIDLKTTANAAEEMVRENRPFIYWQSGQAQAVRRGDWKLHVPHQYRSVSKPGFGGERGRYTQLTTGVELYNVLTDPEERYNRAEEYPGIVTEFTHLIEAAQREMDANKRPAFVPGE